MSQEQLRIRKHEKADAGDIETKVDKVIELTKASKDAAVVALHDCDFDLNRAVSKILEGDSDDNWTSVSSKSKKEKEKVPPAKSQVTESAAKQANGTSHKIATTGPRNRTAATTPAGRKERPTGERPNRTSKQRDENAAPRDATAAGPESQPDGRPRGPRPPRPPRDSGPRSGAERRPDGVRRSDGTAGGAGSSVTRPRGPRTFSSQQKAVPPAPAADDFPNSIDTWTNTTADPNARPAPAPITSMTVGNWSDVVSGANEDWSEEDYESSLMETKVFVPSGKSLPEADELSPQTTHVQVSDKQKRGPGSGTPAAPPPPLDRKEAAGAQILQSLKQPVSQSGYGQISQSYINKQAAESIKSLVGIPTAAYTPTATAPPAPHHPASDPKPAPRPANQSRRTTRIPESAVEMPSNDSVASLGVQFGALDVSFASADTQSYVKPDVQPLNHKTAMSANTQGFEQQAKAVLSDDMIKRHDALSGKPEQVIDSRNAVAKHVKSSIDSVKGPDLYSVSGSDYKGSASYGNTGSYSAYSGVASTSGQFNVYANPASYASSSYSTNYQPVAQKNMSNLKDAEASVQQKHTPAYEMHSPAGLVNSTQTTNVLKNSLSATGKGNIGNQNMPRMLTQLMHPSYIMGGMASPAFYPLFDPSMQMPPAAAQDASGYAAAYNQPADTTKFARSDGVADGTAGPATGVSSQNPVVSQHSQQQFISPLPPGYGFYYMPSAPGLYPPQGGQFVPVPPVSNAHASSAPGFPKGSYAAHSYAGAGYDSSALTMQPDYSKTQGYAQNQSKAMPSSDLMGQSSSYNKPHGVSKVCFDPGFMLFR